MPSKTSKTSKLEQTEVAVTYTVSRELTYVTTASDIRAMLVAAGDLVNEPDLDDLAGEHDASDLVHRLLEANPGVSRDAWLTTVTDVEIIDETVSIEEVTEV